MAKILVLQHSPYEPLGIIVNTLRRMRMRIRFANFHRNPEQRLEIKRYQGLVILGGNLNPDQCHIYEHLRHEMELIEDALKHNIPVLGICLGSQLLNMVLGGECFALETPEFGWVNIQQRKAHPLFESWEKSVTVFQWHQYANAVPNSVEVIYQNTPCVQAFAYGKNVLGLQFHLEVDEQLLQRWLEHPDYLEHLQTHIGWEEIESIRQDTNLQLNSSMRLGAQLFERFCELFDKKKYALGSKSAGRDLY